MYKNDICFVELWLEKDRMRRSKLHLDDTLH